jgi:hypothetical protein
MTSLPYWGCSDGKLPVLAPPRCTICRLYGNRFRYGSIVPSAVMLKGKQSEPDFGEDEFPVPSAMPEKQISEAIEGLAGMEIPGAKGHLKRETAVREIGLPP